MADNFREPSPSSAGSGSAPGAFEWLSGQAVEPAVRYARDAWAALTGAGQDHAAELREVGDRRAGDLAGIRGLTPEEQRRIAPVVAGAARTLHARHARSERVDGFAARYPALCVAPLTLVFVAGCLLVAPWAPAPDGTEAKAAGVVLALVAVLAIAAGRRVALYLWGALPGVAGVGVFTAAVTALAVQGRWTPKLQAVLTDPDVRGWGLQGVTVDDLDLPVTAVWAVGLLVAAYGAGVLAGLFAWALVAAVPRHPVETTQCAALLDGFLGVALLLEQLTQPPADQGKTSKDGPGPGEDTRVPGTETPPVPYVASVQRQELLTRLEALAHTAEWPWRRAVRTGDRAVDRELARTAHGIAAAVRGCKPAAALGGTGLGDLRERFTAAVVDAADGNWARLASSRVPSHGIAWRRVRRWARSGAGLVLLAGGLAVAVVNPVSWSAPVTAGLLVLFGGALAGDLAALLDPRARERLEALFRFADAKRRPVGASVCS